MSHSIPLESKMNAILTILYKLTGIIPKKKTLKYPVVRLEDYYNHKKPKFQCNIIKACMNYLDESNPKFEIVIHNPDIDVVHIIISESCNENIEIAYNLDNPEQYLDEATIAKCKEWAKLALTAYLYTHHIWFINEYANLEKCRARLETLAITEPGFVNERGTELTAKIIANLTEQYNNWFNKHSENIHELYAKINSAKQMLKYI